MRPRAARDEPYRRWPIRHTPAADGTSIAWRCQRAPGDLAMIFCNGLATDAFYWRHVLARFQGRATLLVWDYRGHGHSEAARDLESLTIPACVDDMRRVLDAAGVDRAVVCGFSLGCQVALESWRHVPERVRALVPALGTYERPFDQAFHPAIGPRLFEVFRRAGPPLAPMMMRLGALGASTSLGVRLGQWTGDIGPQIPVEHMLPFFEHFAQLDGASWAAMAIAARRHSAHDLLPRIDAPALVITGGRDAWTPAHMGEQMHRRMPDCELAAFPEASHTGLLGLHGPITDAIEGFLRRRGLLPSGASL